MRKALPLILFAFPTTMLSAAASVPSASEFADDTQHMSQDEQDDQTIDVDPDPGTDPPAGDPP